MIKYLISRIERSIHFYEGKDVFEYCIFNKMIDLNNMTLDISTFTEEEPYIGEPLLIVDDYVEAEKRAKEALTEYGEIISDYYNSSLKRHDLTICQIALEKIEFDDDELPPEIEINVENINNISLEYDGDLKEHIEYTPLYRIDEKFLERNEYN